MKYLVALLLSVAALSAYSAEPAKAETKKICVDIQGKDGKPVVDPKTKKVKQDCKEVKKHKKHEGTEVPTKK